MSLAYSNIGIATPAKHAPEPVDLYIYDVSS